MPRHINTSYIPIEVLPYSSPDIPDLRFTVDGLYESILLPSYNVGYLNMSQGTAGNLISSDFNDLGPVNTFNPRLDSGGVRVDLNYDFTGTPWQINLGGAYTSGTQKKSTPSITPVEGITLIFLDGTIPYAGYPGSNAGNTILEKSSLHTTLQQWDAVFQVKKP